MHHSHLSHISFLVQPIYYSQACFLIPRLFTKIHHVSLNLLFFLFPTFLLLFSGSEWTGWLADWTDRRNGFPKTVEVTLKRNALLISAFLFSSSSSSLFFLISFFHDCITYPPKFSSFHFNLFCLNRSGRSALFSSSFPLSSSTASIWRLVFLPLPLPLPFPPQVSLFFLSCPFSFVRLGFLLSFFYPL